MYIFKIQKNQNTIAYLQKYASSKAFYKYCTGLYKRVEIPENELFNGVQSGKIAIFPVYENQNMDIILFHYKNNFDCYLLPYRDYMQLKKHYVDSLVLSTPEHETIKQQSLF